MFQKVRISIQELVLGTLKMETKKLLNSIMTMGKKMELQLITLTVVKYGKNTT